METGNYHQTKRTVLTAALVLYFALLIFLAVLSSGCNKHTSANENDAAMEVKMTDAPAAFLNVFVDVKEFRIHYTDESKGAQGWVTLNTNAKVYDLLELQNDITAVVSNTADLPEGRVNQIRLVLGSNNYVITADSIPYPLIIPSGEESGLKIQTDAVLVNGNTTEVVIDFDAAASIRDFMGTSFKMIPVIKVKSCRQK